MNLSLFILKLDVASESCTADGMIYYAYLSLFLSSTRFLPVLLLFFIFLCNGTFNRTLFLLFSQLCISVGLYLIVIQLDQYAGSISYYGWYLNWFLIYFWYYSFLLIPSCLLPFMISSHPISSALSPTQLAYYWHFSLAIIKNQVSCGIDHTACIFCSSSTFFFLLWWRFGYIWRQ